MALAITAILFFTDLAIFTNENGLYRLAYDGVYAMDAENKLVMPAYALLTLLVATELLLLVVIFLYRKRILQIRLCGMGLGLLIGLWGMIYYFGKTASREMGTEHSFTWAMIVPLISLVLVYMAIKYIGKDEALVQSLNRIR